MNIYIEGNYQQWKAFVEKNKKNVNIDSINFEGTKKLQFKGNDLNNLQKDIFSTFFIASFSRNPRSILIGVIMQTTIKEYV